MELEIQDVLNKQQGMNLFMDRNLVVFFNLNSTITSYFSLLGFYIVFLGFPRGSASKESACSAGDLGSSPRLGLVKGMAIHCSILAWRIPWTIYKSMESQRVGHH